MEVGSGAGSDDFTLFPRLPAEIRLRIWEMTWPSPRVVEHACRDNPEQPVSDSGSDSEAEEDLSGSHDPAEFDYLRLSGGLSHWLREDFSSRDETVNPLERCADPVALHVCAESRVHTLHRYTRMHHPQIETSAFYIDPRSDFLWLGHDFESEHVDELRRYYGPQVDTIERVIVEELGLWADSDVDDAIDILDLFGGLRFVRVILENYQFSGDDEAPPTAADYLQIANTLLGRDEPMLQGKNWRVEYTDREGNVYRHFQGN